MNLDANGPPIRVIQVGLGGFGRSWAQLAHRTNGLSMTAAVDPFPAAREWAARELDAQLPLFASLSEALQGVESDAVLVITPPPTHHAIVSEALRAGKHVLVEKPLAMSLAEADELIALSDAVGRILMVSQNYRHRAPLRAVQQFVADGQLGDLIAVNAEFRRHTQTLFGEGNFRYQMKHPLVLDMSIHHFDMLRAITGRNVISVDARSWKAPGTWYQHDPAATALMELAGGIPFTYQGDWAPLESVPDTSWNADWTIRGELGSLVWVGDTDNAFAGKVIFESHGGNRIELQLPRLDAIDREGSLLAFWAAVVTNIEPETSAKDNINSLAIVLAAIASIEQREAVTIAGMREDMAEQRQ
jgi:predicted dehydrogenase